MNNPQESSSGPATGLRAEFLDPAPLRLHPLHKTLPPIQTDSIEWHAFVDGVSAAGPEGIPPIYVTSEGFVIDGRRRLMAAKQLQWPRICGVARPEWEAAAIMVESLLGQRHLAKGAKVYLCLGMLKEYVQSAESRRLANLKRGTKTLEKPLKVPNTTQWGSGKGRDDLAARLGCGHELIRQAVCIRRFFELPALREHKFHFQDGSEKTLREHFEGRILDAEAPMGLGEVLKGIGWFVDEQGKPKQQAPPERNSHLFYWDRAWKGWAKQCGRWEGLENAERAQALAVVKDVARELPDQVVTLLGDVASEEKKRRRKAAARGVERRSVKGEPVISNQ